MTRLETVLETVLPTLATKADVAEARAEARVAIADVKTDLIKVLLTGLAITVGILVFAINRALPTQAVSTPIVIYAQQPNTGEDGLSR